MNTKALILLSGGQDSVTCLAWARERFSETYTVAFDYGQRHAVELDAAVRVSRILGAKSHKVIQVRALGELGGSALTSDEPVQGGTRIETGLPNTFVPGRNLIFLSLASAYAYHLGINDIVTGVCQADFTGYPDCRQATINAMVQTLSLGLERPFLIHTPLMDLSKADTVRKAIDLNTDGTVWEALAWSHTCYNSSRPCGACPACLGRAKGFKEAGISDPLLDRISTGIPNLPSYLKQS